MAAPKTTRLSDDVTKPQPTDPGDAPADTFDPNELATSVSPDKAAAAADGHQTVNAVIKSGTHSPVVPSGTRTETYKAFRGDNVAVDVSHNYDTGVTSVTPVTPPTGG